MLRLIKRHSVCITLATLQHNILLLGIYLLIFNLNIAILSIYLFILVFLRAFLKPIIMYKYNYFLSQKFHKFFFTNSYLDKKNIAISFKKSTCHVVRLKKFFRRYFLNMGIKLAGDIPIKNIFTPIHN